ncbi:MAG: T9SS type A sorting domain-containing protein [Candidatus Cloacimonetes bacterium]|nr:T9SS type A sorting domain-containing protein [Candidatus Cloacimonadota bacterium]
MKCLVLFITLILISTALTAQTAIAPTVGDGTENSPYRIASLENLYWIAAGNDEVPDPDQELRLAGHYIQIIDIDASETVDWFEGMGWLPIGLDYDEETIISFSGTYDGQGYTIEGLFIDRPDILAHIGLFAIVSTSDSPPSGISNLGLTNVDITGQARIGSLAGRLEGSSIINCYSSGLIYGIASTGGLVGVTAQSSMISDSYSSVNVTGPGNYKGGLVGVNGNTMISNCYSTGNVNGTYYLGGLVGSNQGQSKIFNSHYNYEEVLINDGEIITIGALDGAMFNDWINNDMDLNIHDYLTTDGVYFLINDVADFRKLLAFGQATQSFLLTTDLDLSDEPSFYIPYFSGYFDGNGHQISNLTLDWNRLSDIGLFGYAYSATVQNLAIIDIDVIGRTNTGGLIGTLTNNGTVHNCYTTGSLQGDQRIGGLVGALSGNSTVSHSYSETDLISDGYGTGGLVGESFLSTVSVSYSTGNVSGNSAVGGLIGYHGSSTTENSYSTGSVNGLFMIGGLIGHNQSSLIDNCYSYAVIIGLLEIGGLIGRNDGNYLIVNSYWDIEASGQSESAGGEGRTTADMTYPYSGNTYVEWDFIDIWSSDIEHDVNQGYPYLREFDVSVDDEQLVIIQPLSLSNYPNPFNPETTILFDLPQQGAVQLIIFNIKGQKVKTLLDTDLTPGTHSVVWNGRDDNNNEVAGGIYFYRLLSKDLQLTNKMLLLK